MNSDVKILETQRNFLYQDLNDLMARSIYSEDEKQRIFTEFRRMLGLVTDATIIVEITDFIYELEVEMDPCLILKTVLRHYGRRTIRKGKRIIKR